MATNRANVLTPSQLERFERDGYLVLRQAFDPAVGRSCAEEVLKVLERERSVNLQAPGAARFIVDRRSGAPFDELTSPAVLSAFDELLGASEWERSHLRTHGAFFVTFPGFHGSVWNPPVGVGRWHVDLGYAPVDAFRLSDGNCALVPVFLLTPSYENGAATVVVRGTHRIVARLLRLAETPVPRWRLVAFCEALMARDIMRSRIVQLVGEAGDVAILHPLLIHAASANVTSHVRVMCNTGFGLRGARRYQQAANLSVVDRMIRDALVGLTVDRLERVRLNALLYVSHQIWKLRYKLHGNLPNTVDQPASRVRGRGEKALRVVGSTLAAMIHAQLQGETLETTA